ncbi:phospholipase D-like domain-containing protein [Spartinivicinus poritis]|uniref:Phosphatidylserine/phosphatidylglycerophosphate/ cardiolipin synthase family protein n=1 Tax=Spartinivicinus poritis TaxID=2994640 RepID=A0ABT5UDJ1_9GAMM|nr:phosphatidylserine/phosphatidylglycerophosphate/cardiolipin synthase family protein [Spartinivicinus sp. A2-2]MDE1464441.1 phosphatidylserine/phosphatidylglycerophosphate/cardiolipin synthase family protein [Spartinivicinus sp. A2-2]
MSKYFPWRAANHIELLIDGDAFFPHIFSAVVNAKEYVIIEMYLASSGVLFEAFYDVLAEAISREVKIYWLLDDFGSLGLITKDRQRLARLGVQLVLYNPLSLKKQRLTENLNRNHRKLFLIDGELAYIGGAGITDDFYNPNTRQALWHEVMLAVKGHVVVDWLALFKQTWGRFSDLPIQVSQPEFKIHKVEQNYLARLSFGSYFRDADIVRSLVKQIKKAQHRVWFATPYFLPSNKVRRVLRRAARKGVDVRLLLSDKYTDNRWVRYAGHRYYYRQLREGVKIYEYQHRCLHAKMVLADSWVSIGSCNFDHWDLRWNLDANQEVKSGLFAEEVKQLFEQDFTNCKQFTLEEWLSRPWHKRLREWLFSVLGRLAIRIGR